MSKTAEVTAELNVESMDDFFAKSGPLPTGNHDLRRFPRFYYRSCAEAMIYPLANGKGGIVHCFVLTQDLSRGGVSIVHPVQLFPGQRIEIGLGGRPRRQAVVSWCRRLPKCHYAIGCQFVGEPPEQA